MRLSLVRHSTVSMGRNSAVAWHLRIVPFQGRIHRDKRRRDVCATRRFFEETKEAHQISPPDKPFGFQYLPDSDTKEAFVWYFSFAKPIETSPHVIAEIHGLALRSKAQLYPPRLGAFWKFAKEELAELKLEERFVHLGEMNSGHLQAVGPTDTSLLQRAQQSGCTLLTGDRKLRGRCIEQGIKVLTCAEVLAYWQESA